MKSFTALRNHFGKLSNNSASANLTLGDEIMNDYLRGIYAKRDWPFLHRLRTATTVASTTFVNLPYDMDTVESVYVTVSSTRYRPRPAPSRAFWDDLHYSVQTSDTPQYWFVYNGQIGLWPRPSSAGNTISLSGKIRGIDLSVADYSTGTITSITNGAAALVGGSTVWTPQMVGRYLRITYLDGAATGDGVWYEISAAATNTSITLVRNYGGTTLAAASANYIIGQMSLLPESFHDLPIYYALQLYYTSVMPNESRADRYERLVEKKEAALFTQYTGYTQSLIVDDGQDSMLLNPNLTISL